jgi:arginine-tRNA-protein transferase
MYKHSNILEFVEENKECSYFNDKLSDIQYKFMEHCSVSEQEKMVQRGWRRFGNMHFVPICKNCTECKTIRIDVKNFKFSKSQKRVLNKNKHLSIYLQKPTVTYEHIDLFNKYHINMTNKKNWEENKIDIQEYYNSFVNGASSYGKEILYFLDNKLIAVALCDILEDSISAIYCFYDHDYSYLSLGKLSILLQIKLAKELNLSYVYLGYWIKDHYSMGYKEYYKPFEILQNRPELSEPTIWI